MSDSEVRVHKAVPGEEPRFRSQLPPSGNMFSSGQRVPSEQYKTNYDQISWDDD